MEARVAVMDPLLERLRQAPSIIDGLWRVGALIGAAAGSTDRPKDRQALVEAIDEEGDALTAIAAIHALGRLDGRESGERIVDLLRVGGDWRTPHAAWALAARSPSEGAIRPLVELLAAGRLGGMHAQRTLVTWGHERSDLIVSRLLERLWDEPSAEVRARLVETLGVLKGAAPVLVALAGDSSEVPGARIAALAALGDHPEVPARVVEALARGDNQVGSAARLALLDRRLSSNPRAHLEEAGLRLAQVHLGGRLDKTLAHAGEGQTGGIATLLVQLGDALVQDRRVEAVTTIGRGSAEDGEASFDATPSRHAVMTVPLGPHEGWSFTDPWPARIAAERGIRRILRLRPAGLLHLRMADVGSLAAAAVAREQHVSTVLTLAPDPHAFIAELERTGELDRRSFGPADAREGLWFRAWLVRRLSDVARQVVLFPRPGLHATMRDLVGVDVAADPGRYHVVPEGIDPAPIRSAQAAARRAANEGPSGPIADLRDAIAALGPERQGLPIVVSVGRLIEIKGMARIVEAFASDPELRRRANLVVIGGDLADPSPPERAEIDRIDALLAAYPDLAESLVLLGHRPHGHALSILAVARRGLGPWIAPGGAHVSGSRKEEFGLAIVEALASGLPVVAPEVGGPSSYVEEGRTGHLVDTLDRRALARGIVGALDLFWAPGRIRRAEQLVEQRYTVRSMAQTLVPIYEAARPPRVLVAS